MISYRCSTNMKVTHIVHKRVIITLNCPALTYLICTVRNSPNLTNDKWTHTHAAQNIHHWQLKNTSYSLRFWLSSEIQICNEITCILPERHGVLTDSQNCDNGPTPSLFSAATANLYCLFSRIHLLIVQTVFRPVTLCFTIDLIICLSSIAP